MADDSRVIVAGAGPVGLVAALVLADAGVPVVVLEKRDGLNTASKASTFHAPTLEILDKLGVLQEVIDHGAMVDRAQFRTAVGGIFAEFPLTLLTGETPFPFRLHLEQARVTPLLLRRLRGHAHAAVAFDAEVSGVATEPRGVRVTIRANGRPHEMVGRFLIGADGARSQVRTAIGATFDGEDYPDKILRVMTDEDLNRLVPGIAPITYLFNGMKSVSFLKMPECWRIILRVPKGIPDQQALEPAWILSRLQEAMPQCRNLPHVVAKDVYGVSRRVADPFRSGRVFLIGDAAHLTNTRGGMNMNCGIHDAYAIGGAMVRTWTMGDRDQVEAASDLRRRVAIDQLIPRTDRNVVGGHAWLDHVADMARDRDKSLGYLRATAMIDMTAGI